MLPRVLCPRWSLRPGTVVARCPRTTAVRAWIQAPTLQSRAYSTEFTDVAANAPPPTSPPQPLADEVVAPLQPTTQFIREVDNLNFQQLLADTQLPIIVECYTPSDNEQVKEYQAVVRQLVVEEEGYLILARLDVSKASQLAQELGIQSVPTLVALADGKVLNAFPGIGPAENLARVFGSLMGIVFSKESAAVLEEGDRQLLAGDVTAASQHYNELVTTRRFHMKPLGYAALIQLLVSQNEISAAETLADKLKEDFYETLKHPRVKKALSALELSKSGADLSKEGDHLAAIDANPQDWEAHYQLGVIYRAAGEHQKALNEMLAIVKGDRDWNDGAARDFLEKFFNSFDEDDEFAVKGRRRLRNLWYL